MIHKLAAYGLLRPTILEMLAIDKACIETPEEHQTQYIFYRDRTVKVS